jgi:hypothetical protein
MRTLTIGLVVVAMGLQGCGGAQTAPPASTPPVASSPAAAPSGTASGATTATGSASETFVASGTFSGSKFSFTCVAPGAAAAGADTLAVEGTGEGTVLSCHDLTTGITVTLTLVAPAVGKVAFTHTHVGTQIGFATPAWGTSSITPATKPDLAITAWDADHRTGTYSFSWDDPKNGGSIQGTFSF